MGRGRLGPRWLHSADTAMEGDIWLVVVSVFTSSGLRWLTDREYANLGYCASELAVPGPDFYHAYAAVIRREDVGHSTETPFHGWQIVSFY